MKRDLRQIFLGLQRQMVTTLQAEREIIGHPTTKGTSSELQWLKMLGRYLPKRYSVDKAFVLDCNGTISDQIDVVIYDRQYSPFLFNQDDAKYIPAESVYAVLEVKPEIDGRHIKYAGEKAASVRRLERTSAFIPHAGGVYAPKQPPYILAGILALESSWNPPFATPFNSALLALQGEERLDLGCALRHGGFRIDYEDGSGTKSRASGPDTALIFFFLTLLSKLQAVGTVAAVDFEQYARIL
ncbi:MAG: hypothetical protein PHP88_06270 [bacterium]|nr:hypothetical protein [bacterium]